MIRKIPPVILFHMILLFPVLCLAQEVPVITSTGSTFDSITVTWTLERDNTGFEANSFKVVWGTSSANLDKAAEVSSSQNSFTITGLDHSTDYFVAVCAVDEKTGEDVEDEIICSTTEKVTTEPDTTVPARPTGFGITNFSGITENSVALRWDENSEADLSHYLLAYRSETGETVSEEIFGTEITVNALQSSTRYFFTLRAVDDSGNESDPAPELVVDTLPDDNPPNPTADISVRQSGVRSVRVSVESGNARMADFVSRTVNYGRISGELDLSVDMGSSESIEIEVAPDTWYFEAVAIDSSGNRSDPTEETAITIEETESFLDRDDDYDDGCFIGSISGSAAYDVTENKNKIGAGAGYFLPADSDYDDFYDDDLFPAFIFFERGIGRYISLGVRGGYMEASGIQRTVSGLPTAISTDLTLVPVSASLNVNFPIADYMWAFMGAGPDYWYAKEEIDDPAAGSDTSEWTGGYHGRVGLWLYNSDPFYRNWGMLAETRYSRIDGFGDNDIDLGGWMFILGFFYGF